METYFNLLNDDLLSVLLEHIIEFNDALLLINLSKIDKRFENFNNDLIYFNLLNNLKIDNEYIKKFVKDFYRKNKILSSNLTTNRQLKYAVIDADTLLREVDYNVDFLFDIQLININLNILNVDGIDIEKIKAIYNLYLDNRYEFIDPNFPDEGPPQLLISYNINGNYLCEVNNYGYNYGDPQSDLRRRYYEFYINENQLKCLIISLLFNNYNIPLLKGRAYDLIAKYNNNK